MLTKPVETNDRNDEYEMLLLQLTADRFLIERNNLPNKSFFQVKTTKLNLRRTYTHKRVGVCSSGRDAGPATSMFARSIKSQRNHVHYEYHHWGWQCWCLTIALLHHLLACPFAHSMLHDALIRYDDRPQRERGQYAKCLNVTPSSGKRGPLSWLVRY